MKKHFLILLLFLTSFSFAQEEIIELLKTTLKEDAFKTIILGDSILQNEDLSKYERASIKYYQALGYQKNRNYKKAITYLDEIIPIIKTGEKTRYIAAILNQSNSNVYMHNYTIATTQALQAKEIATKNKLTDLIASANTALSFIYYSNQKYIRALEFLAESESLFIEEKKDVELSAVYNNMAIIYKKIGAFQKAISYNEKSLEISIKNGHHFAIGKSYSNIGRLYSALSKFDMAHQFYTKAIEINSKNNISNSLPYENIAELFREKGELELAEENFKKALKIEIDNENFVKIKANYESLLRIAIQTKNFEKAYDYQLKIEKTQGEIDRDIVEEKIKMIESQGLLVQKQQELVYTQKQSKNQFIFFVALTFLLLFFGLFIFQRSRNTKLQAEKEKVILEQRVLRSQMNPHFIFNALSAIQNSLLDNEPIKSAAYLSRFAKLIRQNFDFINEKKISLNDEIDALQNYLDTQKMRFQDKFDYEINIFANVDIHNTYIPPILIQPFVENSIEHGFKNKKEKGKIIINISRKENHICYEIRDNGKGFQDKKETTGIHAIDVFKKRLKLLGNNDEKSFKINSSNQGTQIKFCLKQ